jgi:outer membrane protein OmpA-like peptidoglycan-associated protein
MPEATPVPSDSDATVESAPAVTAPEPPAEEASAEPVEEPAAAPEAPAPEVPAPEATTPEAPAAETSVAAVTPEAPPAETAASDPEPAEEPAPEATEEGAAEEGSTETEATAAPEPDNSQPAAPIPQGGIRIVFPTDLNDVPSEANAALDDLASQMLADENMRIQIKCYASGTEDTESKARRKSLARCINIRQYLFKKDVRTTRMDVRALGLKSEGQPADPRRYCPA